MSRTDVNRNDVKWGLINYDVFDKTTGALESHSEIPRQMFSIYEKRESVNTPNFRSRRKLTSTSSSEDLPMNPFLYVKEVHHYPSGRITRETAGKVNVWSGLTDSTFPFSFSGDFDSLSSLDAGAHNTMLENLKQSKVNVLQALGERKQTARLLYDTASRVATAVAAARNGNLVLAAKNLGIPYNGRNRPTASKQLADDWLAMKFGWEPLIQDIKGAAESLARANNRVPRFKVSGSKTSRYSKVEPILNWGPPTSITQWGNRTVKYVSYFTADNELLSEFSSMGVTNIPSAIYQLTPWSFVLDWFLDVGTFIDLLDAGYGMRFEKGCKTIFERETMKYKCSGLQSYPGDVYLGQASAFSSRVYCLRTTTSGFGLPSITLGSGLGTGSRGLNAVALLRQQLRK